MYSTRCSVAATGIREVASQAGTRQPPGLRERRRLIGERLRRRKIVHAVLAHPGISCEQQRRTEYTGECQPYIKACHVLPLILSCRLLIVRIRDLKPGPGGGGIQMERGCIAGSPVKALKYILSIATRMERQEFRRIQKTVAAYPVERHEIP